MVSGADGTKSRPQPETFRAPSAHLYGMPIGQISFMRMDGPVEHRYGDTDVGSNYQGQAEPTPSRFYKNFEREPT
jgi:deoxycytidine triphosphate deaminase